MSGRYDVECYRCCGKRVEPVIDEARANPEDLKRFHEQERNRAQNYREDYQTRKMESGGWD